MMGEQDNSQEKYNEWCELSDKAFSMVNKFEVTRRKAYLHANLRYDMPQLEDCRMRSQGLYYVKLNGLCKTCDGRHVQMSVKTYLMWHINTPFQCIHKESVESIRMEPDPNFTTTIPEITLPPECIQLDIEGMTRAAWESSMLTS